jgi:hypothetical protein
MASRLVAGLGLVLVLFLAGCTVPINTITTTTPTNKSLPTGLDGAAFIAPTDSCFYSGSVLESCTVTQDCSLQQKEGTQYDLVCDISSDTQGEFKVSANFSLMEEGVEIDRKPVVFDVRPISYRAKLATFDLGLYQGGNVQVRAVLQRTTLDAELARLPEEKKGGGETPVGTQGNILFLDDFSNGFPGSKWGVISGWII